MKKIILTMALASSLNVILTKPADAAKVIDQLQPNIDNNIALAIGGDSNSEQKLAQTMTIEVTGTLKGIFLPIDCANGRLRISINEVVAGEPGTLEYTAKQLRASRVSESITKFRYFALPGNLEIYAGDEYAVVLENRTGSCGISGSPEGDSYIGGGGFFDARPNAPGWISFEATESRFDLPFMLLIKTP